MPNTRVLQYIKPQINFLWNNHIEEIPSILTFTVNVTHIVQNFINLPVYANILCIFDPPKIQRDKRLDEFLKGEIRCQNFINQDLTFLQPSEIHASPPKEDSMLLENNTTVIPPTTTRKQLTPGTKRKLSTNFTSQSAL